MNGPMILVPMLLDDSLKEKLIAAAQDSELVFIPGRDRKSTRLNSSHDRQSRMPSSA